MADHQIKSETQLRAITGDPVHKLVLVKSADTITSPMRVFIEQSPFVCLAIIPYFCSHPSTYLPEIFVGVI